MDEKRNDEVDKKYTDFVYWVLTGLLVIAIPYVAGPKEEFKLALYGILLLVALFVWWARGAAKRRKEAAVKADEHQEAMISEIRDGFKGLSNRVDNLQNAQSSTMRTQLIHYAEQYLAIVEKNGFIDSYKDKLDKLPEKELDTVIEEYQRSKNNSANTEN